MSKKGKHANYFFAEPHDGKNHENESFARFTVENRFPKIFREHCSGDYETDFLNKSIYNALMVGTLDDSDSCDLFTEFGLDRFLYMVNEKIRHPYRDCSVPSEKKLHKKNNNDRLKKSSTLKEFFDNAPFFESEILFYHALLAQKKYFLNHYDFFATEKKDSLVNGQDKFIENLNSLFASELQEKLKKSTFHGSIQYCLSANTSDLSQLNAKERFNYEAGDIRIMYDDTDVLYEYLSTNKKFKRFDIICDNAGKELFSDLYLACYFLSSSIVDKVVFHLKPYPFFVSDATKEDFGFMMNAVTQHGGSECASRCNEYILNGNIEIEDNAFWASPFCFKDMPHNELYKRLCDSDLIIVKGDLNYRRLVEDRDWKCTDSFFERTHDVFGRAPIFAPRVIKSDVLVGVSEAAYQTAKSSDKHGAPADQRFKGSGKWAVVHFRCDKYDQYKEKVQKEVASQQNHDDAGDSKHKETKHPAKDALEQQKTKKSANEKKDKFYITINICYILATVLILAMLAVSTIPVIAQTIAIAHENSALLKNQEKEIIEGAQENNDKVPSGNSELQNQPETERPATASSDSNLSEQMETKQPAKTAELKYGDVAGRIDFTLLLTGYAIFITGTLLVPKVLLKKEVLEGVEKYADEVVHKKVDKQFHKYIYDTKNELYKTDAQLSRMVAFQLHKEYPIWSIGWAYRSLKRYKNLDSTKIGFLEYRDFIQFLETGVIVSSINKFHNEVEQKFQIEHSFKIDSEKEFPLDSAWSVIKSEAESAKEEDLRPAIRAIKDISDFEYAVRFEENEKLGEKEKDSLQNIAKCAGLFARKLCAAILWKLSSDKSNSPKIGNTYAEEKMLNDLLAISNYGNKSDNNSKTTRNFQQLLKTTLHKILSACENKRYNHNSKQEYFFADENASVLTIQG